MPTAARSALAHLYRRAGFGARPEQLDAAERRHLLGVRPSRGGHASSPPLLARVLDADPATALGKGRFDALGFL